MLNKCSVTPIFYGKKLNYKFKKIHTDFKLKFSTINKQERVSNFQNDLNYVSQ